MIKFAHMADCHIGSWREPKLRDANTKAFLTAVDICLSEKVKFLLISGDLFNTAVPAIDSLRTAVENFKKLKDAGIPIYLIAGSHDYSPSGKTMLDVLESAGLATNVGRFAEKEGKTFLGFVTDKKTGVKITGLFGKKGGLEKSYYHTLHRENLEKEDGEKIFMFHSPLEELKPEELGGMEAMSVSLLPKGFNYYAGGHVHVVDKRSFDSHKNIIYPGPIFPNNFAEVEKLGGGGFCIVEDWKVTHIKLIPYPVVCIKLNFEGMTVREANNAILREIDSKEVNNAVVTIRAEGRLKQGCPPEIDFKDIFNRLYEKGAYFVMKNTNKLTGMNFEEVPQSSLTNENFEEEVISEHAGKSELFEKEKEIILVKDLIKSLAVEKEEGERIVDFENRLRSEIDKIMGF